MNNYDWAVSVKDETLDKLANTGDYEYSMLSKVLSEINCYIDAMEIIRAEDNVKKAKDALKAAEDVLNKVKEKVNG